MSLIVFVIVFSTQFFAKIYLSNICTREYEFIFPLFFIFVNVQIELIPKVLFTYLGHVYYICSLVARFKVHTYYLFCILLQPNCENCKLDENFMVKYENRRLVDKWSQYIVHYNSLKMVKNRFTGFTTNFKTQKILYLLEILCLKLNIFQINIQYYRIQNQLFSLQIRVHITSLFCETIDMQITQVGRILMHTAPSKFFRKITFGLYTHTDVNF